MNTRITLGIVLGIGIGLVLSSSVYMITNNEESYDKEFIKMEARKMGMIDPEEVIVREDKPRSEDEQIAYSPVVISIPKGSTSHEIARILKEEGIITSEEEFIRMVQSNKASNKLIWGVYEFMPNAKLEDILEALTKGNG